MKITPIKYNCANIKNVHFNKTKPPVNDSVSFCAMKKSQFSGVDLAVVNKYQPPIEKFNTNDDLQAYCKNKLSDVSGRDYVGRSFETYFQREDILGDWFDYLIENDSKYPNTAKLLILDDITRNLKATDDKLPIGLHREILNKTLSEISSEADYNPKLQVNFLKKYARYLRDEITQNMGIESDFTGWVKIPSYENDKSNFGENVQKLKLLSHHNWCTKSYNALPCLKKGDIHIYFDKGFPKLAFRYKGDTLYEIQGTENDTRIPQDYMDVALKHIGDSKCSSMLKYEVEEAINAKAELEKLREASKNKKFTDLQIEKLFKIIGIEAHKDSDGYYTLSTYRQPSKRITFKDLNIDENELFKKIRRIEGDADFKDSKLIDLGELRYIGGDAHFEDSDISSLRKLLEIGKDAHIHYSRVVDLGELKRIGEIAYFNHSMIRDISKLEYIGSDAYINGYIPVKRLMKITKGDVL